MISGSRTRDGRFHVCVPKGRHITHAHTYLTSQAGPEVIAHVATPPVPHNQSTHLFLKTCRIFRAFHSLRTAGRCSLGPSRGLAGGSRIPILNIFAVTPLSMIGRQVFTIDPFSQTLYDSLQTPKPREELGVRRFLAPSGCSSGAWEYAFDSRFLTIGARVPLIASDLPLPTRGTRPWVEVWRRWWVVRRGDRQLAGAEGVGRGSQWIEGKALGR